MRRKHKIIASKNREKLKSVIDRNNLTDVWRTLNPKLERYTWRQKTPNIQCRLDFFLISIAIVAAILKMVTGRNFSMSGINLGHPNLPTYAMSLKSDNVEFVQYCGGHFENGDR